MENKKHKRYCFESSHCGYVTNSLKEAKEIVEDVGKENLTIMEYTLIDGKWVRTYEDDLGVPNKEDVCPWMKTDPKELKKLMKPLIKRLAKKEKKKKRLAQK